MDHFKIDELVRFMNSKLHIDIPLYYNNPKCAIRFNFDDISTEQAENIIDSVIHFLFGNYPFWVCEYGSISGKIMLDNHLFSTQIPEIIVVPYLYTSEDGDWFEYDHDAIACVHTEIADFSVRKYITYVLEREFIYNTIFLIDETREIALYAYDRRGMDIASTDKAVLGQLSEKFNSYVSKSV